jgi:sporulation protein YlmC with PRC-barrel domain
MMYVADIRGKEVIDKQASIVGVVDDVAIDERALKVLHLVVTLDKSKRDSYDLPRSLFGGGKKIQVLAEEVDAIADKVLLNQTLAELLEIGEDTDEGEPT